MIKIVHQFNFFGGAHFAKNFDLSFFGGNFHNFILLQAIIKTMLTDCWGGGIRAGAILKI